MLKKKELYIDLYKVLQKVYIFFLIFYVIISVRSQQTGSLIIALPVSVVVLEVLTSRMPLLDLFFCILCFYFLIQKIKVIVRFYIKIKKKSEPNKKLGFQVNFGIRVREVPYFQFPSLMFGTNLERENHFNPHFVEER